MKMKRFAPIALPPTFKRTSLAQLLLKRANPFSALLAQLAPRVYDQMPDKNNPLQVYNTLVQYCDTLFPVWFPCFDEELDPGEEFTFDDEGLIYNMDILGIPVNPIGLTDHDAMYGQSAALSAVSYYLESRPKRQPVAQLIINRVGQAWTGIKALERYDERHIERVNMWPPVNQVWSGRWQNLEWLVKYVQHDTGYQWLDLCIEDMDEGGNPPWTMEDIKFLKNDWADAKAIWMPLQAFIKWIDARPVHRLPMVLGALMGDQKIRAKMIEPNKPGKTLFEVFNGEPQKQKQSASRRAR
ncbi:MAG: hypothetical protein ACOYBO_10700 [Azonexus sp.]